jgi:hypothetical protein
MRTRKAPDTPVGMRARAIAEAQIEKPGVVAKRYGVAVRTLREWESSVATNPELAELVFLYARQIAGTWVSEGGLTMATALRRLRAMIEGGELTPVMLLGAIRTIGDTLTQHSALVEDPHGAPPADPRDDAEAPAAEAAGSARGVH